MELAGEVKIQYVYKKDTFLCHENGCSMISKQHRTDGTDGLKLLYKRTIVLSVRWEDEKNFLAR